MRALSVLFYYRDRYFTAFAGGEEVCKKFAKQQRESVWLKTFQLK